jgi:transcriptional regulator with XRE-family HTH domain
MAKGNPEQRMSKHSERLRANVLSELSRRGITITEICSKTGMSRASLSHFLHGRADVTIGRASTLADAMGVDLADLLRSKKKVRQPA